MHYFIEHTNLTQQNPTDTFGVETTDPTNKFDINFKVSTNEPSKSFCVPRRNDDCATIRC